MIVQHSLGADVLGHSNGFDLVQKKQFPNDPYDRIGVSVIVPSGCFSTISVSPITRSSSLSRSSGNSTIMSPVPSAASWQVTVQRWFSVPGTRFIILIPRWSEVDNACLPVEKQPPLTLTSQYESLHDICDVMAAMPSFSTNLASG